MEDKRILSLLWERAENAIIALSAAFGKRLQHTAMNILGNHHDAEESVNDTYLAVWNAIPPGKPDPLAPYVYRIGRNVALNHLREKTAQKRDSSYDLSLDELAGSIAGPDLWEQLSARELGRAMDVFLDTVSRENRVIFLRRYWFGDSVQDIAKALSLTPGAVSIRLGRTRDKLKVYLTEEGFYE